MTSMPLKDFFSPSLPVCRRLIGFVTHGRKSQGFKMIERGVFALRLTPV